ncbi:hypothetical protein V1525DRAFT_338693 [Lipomyces kononenkoae]|uniref:Uncharacterized protein n=1 Tax=Lipomyces kononenkoae TaxID=34357 RepID=A0ACC3T7Q1_LIPKO
MNLLRNRLTASADVENQTATGDDSTVPITSLHDPPETLVEALCALFVIGLKVHIGEPAQEGSLTRGSKWEDREDDDEKNRSIVANVVAQMTDYLHSAYSLLGTSGPQYNDVESGNEEVRADDVVPRQVRFDQTVTVQDLLQSSASEEEHDDEHDDGDDCNDDGDEDEVKIIPMPPRRQRRPLAFEPSSSRKLRDRRYVDTIFAAVSHMHIDRRCTQLERMEAATIRLWHGTQYIEDMLRVRRIIECRNISATLRHQEKLKRNGGSQEKTAALKNMLIRRAREVVGELMAEDGHARVLTAEEMKMLGFFKISPEASCPLGWMYGASGSDH